MEQATSSNRYLFSVPFWIRIHATGSFFYFKKSNSDILLNIIFCVSQKSCIGLDWVNAKKKKKRKKLGDLFL